MPRGRRTRADTEAAQQQLMQMTGIQQPPDEAMDVDPTGVGSFDNSTDQDYHPEPSTQNTEDSTEISEEMSEDASITGKAGRGRGGRGRGRGRGRGGRAGRPFVAGTAASADNPMEGLDPTDAGTLYEFVRMGRSTLQTVVDDWIESYRQNREAASLDLMQFFIRSSGCKGKITPVMRETLDNSQIIRHLMEEFDDESGGDYPLIMTGPQWKKFRSSFCEFIHTLVRQCQYSIIYDQYLMESIISLLITLSDSQVRAFRHTATLAAMKLMTALVDVALTLSINLDNTQRQYENERVKAQAKRASDRLDSLMSKRQELEENMEDIRTMLGYLFKSIFVHRYRDTIPEIRSICMSEIGTWMKRFPNHFLDDSYLKYVGWTLHDKVGDVRLKCLQALLPLYDSEEIARKMELFTNKFKDRIVAMSLDKEYDVAVHGIRLICNIYRHHPEILAVKDCEHVYELVYATHRHVAQAAGEFVIERLFQADTSQPALRSRRGKKRSQNTPLIRDLITFYHESELHEHGAYLVDSLIDAHPMMKDWECMTDLILEEPGPDEEALKDYEESNLIEILVCCIKQAATGDPPIGRGPTRKQISAKELKQSQDDKHRISEHFIQTLPSLLDKYKSDPEKVANLIVIPQYFELSYFTQNQDSLETLLRLLNEIIEIHSDTDVLEGAAKSYEILHDEKFTFSRNVWLSRGTLFDTLTEKYKEAAASYESNEDDGVVTPLLKKLSVLVSCHDLTSYNLWDDVFERWIKNGNQDLESVPIEAMKHAISICHFGLVWELHLLSESRNSANALSVKTKINAFMHQMRICLQQDQEILEEEVSSVFFDTLILCSNSRPINRHSYLSVIY